MRSFLTQMLLTYFLLLSIIQATDKNGPNRLVDKQEQQDDIMLKLFSGDNQEFVIPKRIGIQAETIKNIAENGAADDSGNIKIPLPNIKGEVLQKIVKYMTEVRADNNPIEIPKPLTSTDLSAMVPAAYAQFVDSLTQDELFDLIQAANYLDHNELLELACAKVSSMIKGKTPQEIGKTFNIDIDFTEEE
jgi:S-phase kinase-associated protein 1